MENKHYILTKGQAIDNKYTVQFFLKKGDYAETYRVRNNNNGVKFLKLIELNKLHRTQITDKGEVLEVEILRELSHPNLVRFEDSGEVLIDEQKYIYLVLDFISGETLAEKMARENRINPYEGKNIILSVLNGLQYLHRQGILHNDITNQNIMLDLSSGHSVPKIIDFGYARYINHLIGFIYYLDQEFATLTWADSNAAYRTINKAKEIITGTPTLEELQPLVNDLYENAGFDKRGVNKPESRGGVRG